MIYIDLSQHHVISVILIKPNCLLFRLLARAQLFSLSFSFLSIRIVVYNCSVSQLHVLVPSFSFLYYIESIGDVDLLFGAGSFGHASASKWLSQSYHQIKYKLLSHRGICRV